MDEHVHITDEELMARAAGLDEAAMRTLVARHFAKACRVAARLLGDPTAAEDAAQEAFLRTVRHRESYRPGQPFSPWFYTILRRICIDGLRRRRRDREAMDQLAASAEVVSHPPSHDDAGAMLAVLPRGERDVLTLRIVEQLSFAEVASAMGISSAAARKRAQRGLERLRKHMSKQHAARERTG